MRKIISEFSGDNSYLDSSYKAGIKVGPNNYTCVESALKSIQSNDTQMKSLSENGNTERNILYMLTREKFRQNRYLANKLISTGDSILVGKSLGCILMRVRSELQAN